MPNPPLAATVWQTLYEGTFGSSLYDAVLHLSCDDGRRVHEEAPDDPASADRVGGQFHVVTFGEGPVEEFFDFEFARSVSETDVEIFVEEGEAIEQTRTSGVWLARFHLFGPDHETILNLANELRSGMLKRPEDSPDPNTVESVS